MNADGRAPDRPAGALDRAAEAAFLLWVVSTAFSIAVMSIAGGLCLVLTAAAWIARRERWSATPVDVPALGWLAALVLAALFAADRSGSMPRITKGLFPLLVGIAAWHVRTPARGRRALSAFALATLVACVWGIGGWLAGGAGLDARARGLAGHYMTFAGQTLIAAALAAGVAFTARDPRERGLAGAVLAATIVALVATLTRSAWIGAVVAFALVLALRAPRGLLALGAVVAAAYLFAPGALRERLYSAFDPSHPWNRERVLMWQAGMRMFADHPVFGVGLQDLHPMYERYRSPIAAERVGHLHNVFVQVAATMGTVGLAAFAWLLSGLARACALGLSPRRHGLATGVRIGALAALAGFLVAGLFEWNFGDEELLHRLYLVIGLAWAARNWDGDRG